MIFLNEVSYGFGAGQTGPFVIYLFLQLIIIHLPWNLQNFYFYPLELAAKTNFL